MFDLETITCSGWNDDEIVMFKHDKARTLTFRFDMTVSVLPGY